jgi:F0F1-type ATP synthase assembly protein I
MDLIPKKPLQQPNPGDAIGRGMELALLTLLFLGLGYVLDRWLDTKPIFMIVLVVLALVGQFVSLKYGYEQRMKEHEQARAENARKGRPAEARKGKTVAS